MYSALTVAKYIIKYCNDNSILISNLKLQKLLYFIQAEFLVATGRPCFFEEIEAWNFGPVVPEVYRRYRIFGSANIPTNFFDDAILINKKDAERMDGILEKCAGYSATYLVELTHRQDPWKEAYNPGLRNCVITNESIKEYFSED